MKKIISVLLAVLTVMTFFALPAGAAAGIDSFCLNGFVEDERFSVSWWKSGFDSKYYAFLPSDSDLSDLGVSFTASGDVFVDSKQLISGETTDAFSAGGEFKLSCGSKNYSLVVMKSQNVPSMYIETESGSLKEIHADKSHKEKGTIAVIENGKVTVDTTLSSIKGRGNSTWALPKKPYNIKFDKKVDLFGFGKAKKWSLLALYNDEALIRNTIIMGLSDAVGIMYTSKVKPIDLYINGDYMGAYLVAESVEVGSTRVDITDLDEANEEINDGFDIEECPLGGDMAGSALGSKKWVNIPYNPYDISGGYLLEFDFLNRYDDEISGFVSNNGQAIVLKSPEYASKDQVDYISEYYQEFEDALISSDGKNSLGKHYSEYIDMESFAKMYLIEEYSMDIDAGRSSCYMFKDADSDKFVAAPVWDFDHTLGKGFTRYGIDTKNPELWFARCSFRADNDTSNGIAVDTIFNSLCKHADFNELVQNVWNNELSELTKEATAEIENMNKELEASAHMNYYRWYCKTPTSLENIAKEYDNDTEIVRAFMEKRTATLDKGLGENGAYVVFDYNGGSGVCINSIVTEKGDSIRIASNLLEAPEDCIFIGWNTEKDGSGKSYNLGSKLTLTEERTVLYAQWAKSKLLTGLFTVIRKVLDFFINITDYIIGIFIK